MCHGERYLEAAVRAVAAQAGVIAILSGILHHRRATLRPLHQGAAGRLPQEAAAQLRQEVAAQLLQAIAGRVAAVALMVAAVINKLDVILKNESL